jgi:hypothetical protein
MTTTDDTPVLAALWELEYKWSAARFSDSSRDVRSSFWLCDPQGRERRIKIQKSGPPTGHGPRDRHRHRFGIAFQAFDSVDDFVFWARREAILYIVPTAFLHNVMYNTPGERPKILQNIQWEAHFQYAHDRREFLPTGYGAPISLKNYAHMIPAKATANAQTSLTRP